MRRLRNFAALPTADRWLTVEAAAWLTVALGALALLPFRRVAAWLGEVTGGGPPAVCPAAPHPATPHPADIRQQATARRIGRAVERAARHLPMTARCLPQAIAAMAMLRRRGIASTVHFGMRLSENDTGDRLTAHAWVTVGETGVIGVPVGADDFTPIARFTRETGGVRPVQ